MAKRIRPHKKIAKHVKQSIKKHVLPRLRTKYVLLAFVAIGAGIAWYLLMNDHGPSRLVTFHDRGQNHVILTNAATVRAALQDADIVVTPQDVVEPAIDSQLQSTDSAVIIYRSRPVLVIDGAEREKIVTAAAAPNEIALAAGLPSISDKDTTVISRGDIIKDGSSTVLTISRAKPLVETTDSTALFKPTPSALSASKGAQLYTDSNGVAHRETYYDLPMNIVIGACGPGDYTIRYDGAKIDKDGYVLVAANYGAYPRCSVVETSLGLGKVYDTGGFALRYPHGFDLATDWSNSNGR